jgi:hypothetical protein
MWPSLARTNRPDSLDMERSAPLTGCLRRVVDLRAAHRINLAMATGRHGDHAVDRRSDVLDSATTRAVVRPSSGGEVRLPNPRGHARPIAPLRCHFGIDNIVKSCITRREGSRVGVGLAGSSRSQS